MTEQYTPSDYDRYVQDPRLDGLEELVTPYYQPPAEQEYSFPVVGQGITADQYRQMSLAQGDGIIHRGYRPYYLEGHATSAETNQKNTLILKVDGQHDYSESVIAGFYHRLTGNMELSFPPVTTPTQYHVCITYDPRREDEPTGPVHIEVYAGEPPVTHGRQHIVLNVVHREPNQLLSDSLIIRYRQSVSPNISVQNADQLPDPGDVLYGTIAWAGRTAYRSVVSSWQQLTEQPVGDWHNLPLHNNGSHNTAGPRPQYRRTSLGVQLRGYVRADNRTLPFGNIPSGYRPAQDFHAPVMVSSEYQANVLIVGADGQLTLRTNGSSTSFQNIRLDNVIIPID